MVANRLSRINYCPQSYIMLGAPTLAGSCVYWQVIKPELVKQNNTTTGKDPSYYIVLYLVTTRVTTR